ILVSDWSSDVCSSDLTALQSGPGKFATTLIVDGAIKIIQISGLVVIMHLALRIVAVTVDRFALTAVALYQVSIGNLVLTMIMLEIGRASCRERVYIEG